MEWHRRIICANIAQSINVLKLFGNKSYLGHTRGREHQIVVTTDGTIRYGVSKSYERD